MSRDGERSWAARLGQRTLCHYTYAHLLADIAVSGGLLPSCRRSTPSRHSWGENDDLGQAFVCTSFRPSWGISKRMGDGEAALLILDANTAMHDREICFSPINTWSPHARPFMDATADEDRALSQALLHKRVSEVLLTGEVPLVAIRGIVFATAASRDYWWPHFLVHSGLPERHFDLGGRVDGDGLEAFRFRRDHPTERRLEERRAGIDRRLDHKADDDLLSLPEFEGLTWTDVSDDWTDWPEDDHDVQSERQQLAEELDGYADDMAVLNETGWLPDDEDDEKPTGCGYEDEDSFTQ